MGILKVRAATEYVGHSIENNASLACLTVVLPARGVTCRRIIIKIKYTPCKRGETKREKKKKTDRKCEKKVRTISHARPSRYAGVLHAARRVF